MRRLAAILLFLSSGCGIAFSGSSPSDGGGGGSSQSTSTSTAGTGGTAQGGTGGAGGIEASGGAGGTETGTGGADVVRPCHPSGLTDAFDVELDSTLWNTQGAASLMSVNNGALEINPLDNQPGGQWVGLVTSSTYDVDECSIWIEVPQVIMNGAEGITYFQLYKNGVGSTNIRVEGGMLRSHVNDDVGQLGSIETAYVANAHRWWRIREEGDRIYTETSPDFQTWTILLDAASPTYVGATQIGLGVTSPIETASIGTGRFDNFDTVP